MYSTPIKQQSSENHAVCILCNNTAKEPRNVGSAKTKHNIKDLLLKYGGINVESGKMCVLCFGKLYSLHEKSMAFYNICQASYKLNIHQVKRMASSPSESSSKRKTIAETTTKRPCSKIPTPVKGNVTTPKAANKLELVSISPSKLPTPTFRRASFRENKSTKRKKCLFAEADSNISTILATNSIENIAVGMELEIESPLHHEVPSSTAMCSHESEAQPEKANETITHVSSSKGRSPAAAAEQSEHKYTKSSRRKTRTFRSQSVHMNPNFHAQPESHDYIKSQNKHSKFSSFYEELRSFVKEYKEDNHLTVTDYYQLLFACQTGDTEQICSAILSIDSVRRQLINKITIENDVITSGMTNRKYDPSVLMKKSHKDLKFFSWVDVVDEFKQNFPDLMCQLLSLMLKRESQSLYTKLEQVMPRLGVIYGILMQGRNQELTLIQRLNTSLLFNSICDVKVYDRLQKQGLCLSYEGSLYFLGVIGGKFNETVIDLIKAERRFRIVGDNINWHEGVHDQRKDHTSHMVHAFGSAILVQNVDFSSVSDVYPQQNFTETPIQEFIPSTEDYKLYRQDYTVLMSHVVCKFLPYFQIFEDIIPSKLSQPVSEKLCLKTKVVPMPVLLKNEQKAQDVVDILASYESLISESCTGAGKNFEGFLVHIGGDQLTRERFSQAKCLRAHEDTAKDRFENLSPITFELFHMHTSFLQMVYSILFSASSSQDSGTLKALQNRISRTNVGENINAHYDADKDFFISVVDMYIVECFMEFFGLEDMNSVPAKNIPPEFESEEAKKTWYFDTVGKLIDQFVFSSTKLNAEVIEADGNYLEVVLADGRKLSVKICDSKMKQSDQQDYVMNYGRRVLELGLLYKDLLDVTKLPERSRHISLFKLAMMLFKSHRNLSKYAYEILRVLVHQICILSEKAANEEFYALFVNTNGRFDGHIPAFRRMEYLVKTVKTHLKHMYSNKTEQNIEKRTSAIATISDICERYDGATNVVVRTKRHSDISSRGDELILLDSIRTVRPFRKTPGRYHGAFPNIRPSTTDGMDLQRYHMWLVKKIEQFATELGN